MLNLLKKIPIDLGQGAVADITEGKRIAKRLVPKGAGGQALDIGARHGIQTQWLRNRGYQVTSIDVEPQFPDCLRVDANQVLPFDDHQFEVVWCSEVIEHLKDPGFSLSEMIRITQPGGRVILTTPNSYMWLFRVLNLFGLTPQKLQRQDHIHFFNLKHFQALNPKSEVSGYFPYIGKKWTIKSSRMLDWLTPTFVMCIIVPDPHQQVG